VTVARRRILAAWAAACAVAAVTACTASAGGSDPTAAARPQPLSRSAGSPLAALLAASTDLGPSHSKQVEALVTLPTPARPSALYTWAGQHRLHVGWQHGDGWATVGGAAPAMATGFDVSIHDYRSRSGKKFYATGAQEVAVPAALRSSVTQVGRILSYVPKLSRAGLGFHSDVPNGGLNAAQLLAAYDATPLAKQGFTGTGKTIVFFEIDGFKQSDLDTFSKSLGLSTFAPSLDSDQPGDPGGETPMDLEVAHAIVPDAKLVVFDARTNAKSFAEAGAQTAAQYKAVDQKYPGAIWSISLGFRCESLFAPADLQPMEDALDQANKHGTTAFVSSGDTGSLECKGGEDFGSAPTQADVGLNALAGMPAITVVGGTALSTDAKGNWIAEQAWTESALQQGTSGGPSSKFPRPTWQKAAGVDALPDNTFRMTPDVAADADPATGVKIFVNGEAQQGGGTSQAAPIWAGFAVMLNEYLAANGGHAVGNINPLLYASATATPAAFHDVTLGGNAVDVAQPGFDYTTGLGSPNMALLAGAVLQAQKAEKGAS
jgi:kumamolisin